MRDNNLSLEELGERTRADKIFVEQVVESITVNTTEMFRDPSVWRHLYKKLLPDYRSNNLINIWSAGCSTGQEVYSLKIILNELGLSEKARIYATDISQKAINVAKKGVFNHQMDKGWLENFNLVFNNGKEKEIELSTYFDIDKEQDKITVKPFLRENVNFLRHDLVKNDMPFYNKMDIIICRNVLIYFNVALQNRIVQKFYDNLYNHGALVLGVHEGLSGFFKTKFHRNGPVFTKSNAFHFKY